MKPLLAATLWLAACLGARAAAPENAIIAAMRLAEAPSYTWTCNVTDDARSYDIHGKTQRGGYTWQRQPMPLNIARRLGREAGYDLEAIFSDRFRFVIQTANGWKRLDELPKRHSDWNEEGDWYYVSIPTMRTPDMPADETQFDPFGLPAAIYVPVLSATDDDDDGRQYSNAQFALCAPHEELAVIVSSHADLRVDGDIASGTLNDIGAQLLLVHDGHEYIRPVVATGRFKLWLAGGMVQRYALELAGILVIDRKTVYARQKSLTVVSNIGATTVMVPSDAQRRL